MVRKIQEDLKVAMGTPELVGRLSNQGYEFVGSTSQELQTVIVRDLPHWQEVVTTVGMKPYDSKP